jgi:preprotein translocase subunit SecB
MEKASFSIEKYYFDKVNIDFENYKKGELLVDFQPSGVFNKSDSTFNLTFNFTAFTSKEKGAKPFVNMRCIGVFKFQNANSLEDIPSYFYRNSIALLFPYLRAYVSLVTNQANISSLVLPTMNLISLATPLQENTSEK